MKLAPEMTYTVLGGALNSIQFNHHMKWMICNIMETKKQLYLSS